MRKKLVFLDIDGTILDEDTGITDKTRFAVSQARRNGHYVCIATGRCMAEVREDIQAVDFDGYVCAAGAYIVRGSEVLYKACLEQERLRELAAMLEGAGCFYVLEGVDHLYIPREAWEKLKERARTEEEAKRLLRAFKGNMYAFRNLGETRDVNKISYFWSGLPFSHMKREAERLGMHAVAFSMEWAVGESGELTQKGCHKGEGILRMAEHLGILTEDVLAIGDSSNDVEMLKAAGVGIAMGNASEEVKKAADEVTGSVRQEGVYEAFVRHGLCPPCPEAQRERS